MKFTLEEFLAYRPEQPVEKIIVKTIEVPAIKKKSTKHRFTYNPTKSELVAILKDDVCSACQIKFPRKAMDFHHVRFPKVATISVMTGSNKFSLKDLVEELDKCVLLCSNCHRQAH